jgi:hypothetical protein
VDVSGWCEHFCPCDKLLNESWTPMHVSMGLFEMNETSGHNMVIQFESLLSKFRLMHHVIAFVKDKGSNLTTMAIALCFIIDYEPLKLIKVYEGTCFEHAMYKIYKYATNDEKVYKGLI